MKVYSYLDYVAGKISIVVLAREIELKLQALLLLCSDTDDQKKVFTVCERIGIEFLSAEDVKSFGRDLCECCVEQLQEKGLYAS